MIEYDFGQPTVGICRDCKTRATMFGFLLNSSVAAILFVDKRKTTWNTPLAGGGWLMGVGSRERLIPFQNLG